MRALKINSRSARSGRQQTAAPRPHACDIRTSRALHPLVNLPRLAFGVGPITLRPELPAGTARPGWRRLGRPKLRRWRCPPASSRIGRPTRPLGDPRWSPRPPRLGAPRDGGSPATLHRPGRPLRAQARRRECRRDVDDFGLRDRGEERCEGAMCLDDGSTGYGAATRAAELTSAGTVAW